MGKKKYSMGHSVTHLERDVSVTRGDRTALHVNSAVFRGLKKKQNSTLGSQSPRLLLHDEGHWMSSLLYFTPRFHGNALHDNGS